METLWPVVLWSSIVCGATAENRCDLGKLQQPWKYWWLCMKGKTNKPNRNELKNPNHVTPENKSVEWSPMPEAASWQSGLDRGESTWLVISHFSELLLSHDIRTWPYSHSISFSKMTIFKSCMFSFSSCLHFASCCLQDWFCSWVAQVVRVFEPLDLGEALLPCGIPAQRSISQRKRHVAFRSSWPTVKLCTFKHIKHLKVPAMHFFTEVQYQARLLMCSDASLQVAWSNLSSDFFPKGGACPFLSTFGMEMMSACLLPPSTCSCTLSSLWSALLLHLSGLLWALCSDAAAPDHKMTVAPGTNGNWKLEIVPFALLRHGIQKGGWWLSRSCFNCNCLNYNYNGSQHQEEWSLTKW